MVYHPYTVLYFITEVFFKQVLFTHELSKAFSVHFYVMASLEIIGFYYYFFVLEVFEPTDQNGLSGAIPSTSGNTLIGNLMEK